MNVQKPEPSATTEIQDRLRDVTGIMHNNINKVMERGETLESLQNRTDYLTSSANVFKRNATQMRKKIWWNGVKTKVGCFILFAFVVIIVYYSVNTRAKSVKK